MKRPTQILATILGASALAIFPLLAPSYYVGLMIPFFAYAIALLGFNLLSAMAGCFRSGTRCSSASAPMAPQSWRAFLE